MNDISQNFTAVQKQIRKACHVSGRNEDSVYLVAVTKMQNEQALMEALRYGHRLFGENRVQEAESHWSILKQKHPDIRLHLIGPLQTNKVKEAVALFDCIETVDREKIALALCEEMKKQGRNVPVLIQVNTGEEEQKAGVLPADLKQLLDYCRHCGLDVQGLMCVPPVNEPAALHFAFLKKLARRHGLDILSMGMSADFDKAIKLGASYIRVGSALFGERTV